MNRVDSTDKTQLYNNLQISDIDKEDFNDMQKLQGYFNEITNVYSLCLDDFGNRVTALDENASDVEHIKELLGNDYYRPMYEYLKVNDREEQVIEATEYANIMTAGFKIKIKDGVHLYWIIFGIIDNLEADEKKSAAGFDSMITIGKFYHTVDFFRLIINKIFSKGFLDSRTVEEVLYHKNAMIDLENELKKSAAMTSIVQLLESDNSFEEVVTDVLKITCDLLKISSANIIRINKNALDADIISEWTDKSLGSSFSEKKNIRIHTIPVLGEKPVIYSYNSFVPDEVAPFLKVKNIKALIVMPIFHNYKAVMYVSFFEQLYDRVWELSEIKFINDVVKIVQSILTKRIAKNSFASSYASLEAILNNIGSGLFVRDLETKEILFANKAFLSNFGNDIITGEFDSRIRKAQESGNSGGYVEIFHEYKKRWYDLHFTGITWVDGRKVSLCSVYDVTDKKLYQHKIEQQANNDYLTGLYNRMKCEADLAKIIETTSQNNSQGRLLYMDLDDFKHINDGLGHKYGDELLKSIAHSLQRVKGIEKNCYRMGGDEFIVIITDTCFQESDRIIQDICAIFSKPWFLKESDYYCTMSMGVINFPENGNSVHELIKKADIAMYEAKKKGKNGVSFYNDKSKDASNKRLDMEKNLRNAMTNGFKEFEVYYQPIIDIRKDGQSCTGAEALIRWNSSKLGFISPAEFIPLAEYLGIINEIGNYVLLEACKACKNWNDRGNTYYKVNVNLSVVQLLQPDIVESVKNAIEQTGIDPKNLTLEVTESLAINDMRRMKEILRSIKELGVRIALDDFGTGYSSLNHIKEIPLDVIKVDQSFITDIEEDSYARAFIKMIAELASTIGVKICIEGVETKQQYGVLEDMKVRLVQGYYFDKPMTLGEFENKYLN